VLAAAGIAIPDLKPLELGEAKCTCNCDCVSCTVVHGDVPAPESYELWLSPSEVKKTWDSLVQRGATPVGSEALELWRIASGIPLFGVDIRQRDLPQETEQARALNFNKGCYVGQEIVERIRSRGAVHRKFTGFLLKNAKAAPGTKVIVNEKEVGEITSAASIGSESDFATVALGYIRRETATPGREVMVGSAKANVVQLPFSEEVLTRHPVAQEHRSA